MAFACLVHALCMPFSQLLHAHFVTLCSHKVDISNSYPIHSPCPCACHFLCIFRSFCKHFPNILHNTKQEKQSNHSHFAPTLHSTKAANYTHSKPLFINKLSGPLAASSHITALHLHSFIFSHCFNYFLFYSCKPIFLHSGFSCSQSHLTSSISFFFIPKFLSSPVCLVTKTL